MLDGYPGKAGGSPGEKCIDVDEWAVKVGERISQIRPHDAERSDLAGAGSAHSVLKNDLCYLRCQVAQQSVLLISRNTVYDVVSFFKLGHQKRYFFRRVLQVVVHRNCHFVAGGADTAQQCGMLAVVAHEVERTNP